MKFCCDEFKQDWELTRHARPNIRIVKIDIKEIPQINPKYPYRFYITIGYSEDDINVPRRVIKHCPYCGVLLFKYYKADEYINETNQKFISF
jgi:hypothetical protein